MSRKPKVASALETHSSVEHIPIAIGRGGDCIAALNLGGKTSGSTMIDSFQIGEQMAQSIMKQVSEAIVVMETVKKIPDYNACLCVEQAFQCAVMKTLDYDPRTDDVHLC